MSIHLFKRDSGFYDEIPLLLTVKSFDLKAIQERYLASRGNKSGRKGSVERRKTSIGGLVSARLSNGKISSSEVLLKLPEPRGIAMNDHYFALSSESEILLYGDRLRKIKDPWFSYMHSIDFHPGNDHRFLVASSGYDLILEYEIKEQGIEKRFEWMAWENGFDRGLDPRSGVEFFLTRSEVKANEYAQKGLNYKYINDPENQVLPTSQRAAFINSVYYDRTSDDHILMTFFHEGKVFRLNRKSGELQVVLEGMTSPHGGKSGDWGYLATDTVGGRLLLKKGDEVVALSSGELPGKDSRFGDMEWLQNAIYTQKGYIVVIDSNRTSFIIVDMDNKVYDIIPYDGDWAVQDLVEGSLSDRQKSLIERGI